MSGQPRACPERSKTWLLPHEHRDAEDSFDLLIFSARNPLI